MCISEFEFVCLWVWLSFLLQINCFSYSLLFLHPFCFLSMTSVRIGLASVQYFVLIIIKWMNFVQNGNRCTFFFHSYTVWWAYTCRYSLAFLFAVLKFVLAAVFCQQYKLLRSYASQYSSSRHSISCIAVILIFSLLNLRSLVMTSS